MSDTKQNQATKRKKDALVCLTDHNTFYVGFKGGGGANVGGRAIGQHSW